MPSRVTCPHCQRPSIASEEHDGRTLSCPHCGNSFQVVLTIQDTFAEPTVLEPPPVAASQHVPSTAAIRRRLMAPAIGLIVTGALTTFMGLMFLPALLFPEMMGEQLPWDPVDLLFTVVFMMLTLVQGIVVLFGAIKMMELRSYPLAMTAAIAAMVPWYCCILGLPFGIWAVVVLRDNQVKRAFKRR